MEIKGKLGKANIFNKLLKAANLMKLTDQEEIDMWKDYYLHHSKPKPSDSSPPSDSDEGSEDKSIYDPAGFVGGAGFSRMAFAFPKHLRILNADGSISFEKDLPGNIAGFVSRDSKGNIIANTDTGDIVAFSPYGAKKWQVKYPPIGWWASIVKEENRDLLVCVHSDGVVRGIDTTTGAEVLTLKAVADKLTGLPIHGPDGNFYVSSDKYLHVFKGRVENWKVSAPGGVRLWPGFAFDDKAGHHYVSIVSNSDGVLKFIDADKGGLILWTKKLVNGKFKTPPKMDKDGSVYLYSNKGVYAFNKDGTYKWPPLSFSANILNGTVSSFGNYLLCATDDKKFRIIDKNTGQIKFTTNTGSAPMQFWPSAVGNKLFITNQNGNFIIIRLDASATVQEFFFDSKINTWPHPDGKGFVYFTTEDGAIHVVNSDGVEIRKITYPKRKGLTKDKVSKQPEMG